MKRIAVGLLLLVSASSCFAASSEFPDSAKSAVRALKKLEARCQAGISYKDFNPALGDAKFEVNMFSDSKDSEKFQPLRGSMEKAISYYQQAGAFMSLKRQGIVVIPMAGTSFSPIAVKFLERNPETRKSQAEGGVLGKYRDTEIDVQATIHYLLSQASKEVTNSFRMLNE